MNSEQENNSTPDSTVNSNINSTTEIHFVEDLNNPAPSVSGLNIDVTAMDLDEINDQLAILKSLKAKRKQEQQRAAQLKKQERAAKREEAMKVKQQKLADKEKKLKEEKENAFNKRFDTAIKMAVKAIHPKPAKKSKEQLLKEKREKQEQKQLAVMAKKIEKKIQKQQTKDQKEIEAACKRLEKLEERRKHKAAKLKQQLEKEKRIVDSINQACGKRKASSDGNQANKNCKNLSMPVIEIMKPAMCSAKRTFEIIEDFANRGKEIPQRLLVPETILIEDTFELDKMPSNIRDDLHLSEDSESDGETETNPVVDDLLNELADDTTKLINTSPENETLSQLEARAKIVGFAKVIGHNEELKARLARVKVLEKKHRAKRQKTEKNRKFKAVRNQIKKYRDMLQVKRLSDKLKRVCKPKTSYDIVEACHKSGKKAPRRPLPIIVSEINKKRVDSFREELQQYDKNNPKSAGLKKKCERETGVKL